MLATRNTSTTTTNETRPSSCNSSGISTGCNSSQAFSYSATSTCYRNYDLCAADTLCQTFSYSRSFSAIRIGETIGAGPNQFSGSNLSYSVTTGNLPDGLSLNNNTGIISCTATTAVATSSITITAINRSGSITSTNSMRVYSTAEITISTCNFCWL